MADWFKRFMKPVTEPIDQATKEVKERGGFFGGAQDTQAQYEAKTRAMNRNNPYEVPTTLEKKRFK